MKSYKERYFLGLCIFFSGMYFPLHSSAQDIHFSQFYFAPLSINPANTGVMDGNYRFSTNYKNQWKSIGNAYKTTFASMDVSLLDKKIGIGLSFFSDKAGKSDMGLTKADVSLAYNLQANNENNFIAGIQYGFGQRSINTEGLKWDNQFNGSEYDPNLPSRETQMSQSYSYMDMAAGILWKYASKAGQFKSRTGVALFHINQPKASFDQPDPLKYKMVVHHTTKFKLQDQPLYILPQFLVLMQGPHTEINIGGMLRYVKKIDKRVFRMKNKIDIGGRSGEKMETKNAIAFFAGAQYRWKDAIIPVVGIDYLRTILFSFSYDLNVSKLSNVSNARGGMEFALMYRGSF